jgi:Dynein associated protein
MSMNFKLQSAASRNQARNIDHELKRIEANELKEMLDIVQVRFLSVQVHDCCLQTAYDSCICLKFTLKLTSMQRDAMSFSREWLRKQIL